MIGNIFVESWLIRATFRTTGDHSYFIKSSLCWVLIWKMFLHFPKMQLFTNVLQNRCYYKFPNIQKKTSVLKSLFNKVTGLMACNFIKKETPTQVFSCAYHKMFEKNFFYGAPLVADSEMVEEFPKISKGSLTRNYLWFNLSQPVNCKIMATFCIKIWMIQFLKDWISSTSSSDLYEEISKSNKSHTNHIIQIVLCKTALIQLDKDLYRRIYKRERFVKTFVVTEDMKWCTFFYASSDI